MLVYTSGVACVHRPGEGMGERESRLSAILMLSWDGQPDNTATSLVNKRWVHKPEGRASGYFSMMVTLTFPNMYTHTHTIKYVYKCIKTHQFDSLQYSVLLSCEMRTVPDTSFYTHIANTPRGLCQAEEALCQSSALTTTGEVYLSIAETL